MAIRFVTLLYKNGSPVCAPMPVSLGRLSYEPSDIDYEEAALKSAIQDGLIASRREVIAAVRMGQHLFSHAAR